VESGDSLCCIFYSEARGRKNAAHREAAASNFRDRAADSGESSGGCGGPTDLVGQERIECGEAKTSMRAGKVIQDRHLRHRDLVDISVLCTYFKATATNSYCKIRLNRKCYVAFRRVWGTMRTNQLRVRADHIARKPFHEIS
jgi:hypothetical protein